MLHLSNRNSLLSHWLERPCTYKCELPLASIEGMLGVIHRSDQHAPSHTEHLYGNPPLVSPDSIYSIIMHILHFLEMHTLRHSACRRRLSEVRGVAS